MVMAVRKRVERYCYRHIMPHLKQYQEAPDLETAIPLMTPKLYAQFAEQTCADLARLIVRENGGDRAAFENYLIGFLETHLEDALTLYQVAYQRFLQIMEHAPYAAWDAGITGGELGESLFSGIAGVLAGLTGAFLGGRSVCRELEAEGLRIQECFRLMLEAYDRAMDAVSEAALPYLGGG